MKKYILLAALFTMAVFNISIHAEPVVLDRIAVVVNDNIITESQVQKETNRVLKSLAKDNEPAPKDIVRKEVLNNLINEELKMQQVANYRIKIDNIRLNREIEHIAKNQNLTVYQLYDAVTASGMDYAEYREKLRREIAMQQALSRVIRSKVKISNQEIIDFLNSDLNKEINRSEYHLSHIIIDVAEDADLAAIEKADAKIHAIYTDLLNGKDFAKSAIEHSDGNSSLQGGELGWLKRADLPSRFMQIILEMDNHSISKPFRTTNGFNILKLHDIRGIKKHIIEQVNARHILIQTNEIIDEQQALSKINSMHKSILNGENFAEIAKSSSDDKGSAIAGGELGWASSSNYVPEFKKVVDELPLNKLGQPIKTQYGWHIIEVLGRRSVDVTLEKSRREAEMALLNRKGKEQEELWMHQLRSRAYIDIRDQKS